MATHAAAQQQDAPLDLSSGGSGAAAQPQLVSVSCASKPGERTQCPAVSAAGVAMRESTGSAACLLGKTWGYDDKGIWVMDGCSGRFALYGDKDAGFDNSAEYIGGLNFYPTDTRNHRLNVQVIDVNHSPFAVGFSVFC